MSKFSSILFLSLLAVVGLKSCSDDEQPIVNETSELRLNLNGLQDLGDDYLYEGWIIVDGSPVTTGLFSVDANGTPSAETFTIDKDVLDSATEFVLTIEPNPDPDPAPSAVHILAGSFSGTSSNLTVDHSAAIGYNFENNGGSYIMATPTDDDDTNEYSGVWFLSMGMNGPEAALDLPDLPAGWAYEGWAVIDGTPVSTGQFTSVSGSDSFSGFSGPNDSPPFPGEDFLQNAPAGFEFPVDLRGKTIVISVEPSPDNSPEPFVLKPLLSTIDANAADHTSISLNNNAVNTNPTGTATR